MQSNLERVKEIFLTGVDEETLLDNQERILEWEKSIVENEAILNWQDHDITKMVVKKAKESYRDVSQTLYQNRELTDRQKYEMWGKQDACLFILSLASKNAKKELEEINNEIKRAIDI